MSGPSGPDKVPRRETDRAHLRDAFGRFSPTEASPNNSIRGATLARRVASRGPGQDSPRIGVRDVALALDRLGRPDRRRTARPDLPFRPRLLRRRAPRTRGLGLRARARAEAGRACVVPGRDRGREPPRSPVRRGRRSRRDPARPLLQRRPRRGASRLARPVRHRNPDRGMPLRGLRRAGGVGRPDRGRRRVAAGEGSRHPGEPVSERPLRHPSRPVGLRSAGHRQPIRRGVGPVAPRQPARPAVGLRLDLREEPAAGRAAPGARGRSSGSSPAPRESGSPRTPSKGRKRDRRGARGPRARSPRASRSAGKADATYGGSRSC